MRPPSGRSAPTSTCGRTSPTSVARAHGTRVHGALSAGQVALTSFLASDCLTLPSVPQTFSSIGYFAFVVYALNARYVLQDEESRHLAAGDRGWYDAQIIEVNFRQRTMYFVADVVYLMYAIMLEIGWYQAPRHLEGQLKSVRLQEMPTTTTDTAI